MVKILKDFIGSLECYNSRDSNNLSCSKDLQFMFETHKQRLSNLGIDMDYDFNSRGHFANEFKVIRNWKDRKYSSTQYVTSSNIKKKFIRNGKIFKKIRNDCNIWLTVTDLLQGSDVSNDPYQCPNCGAVSKVSELTTGCPYCRTFFKMSDLFPKVTNYILGLDIGGTEKEVNSDIKRYIVVTWIISTLCYQLLKPEVIIFESIVGGGIFGVVAGYFIWAISKLVTVFSEAGKSVKYLSNTLGSQKKFVAFMKEMTPDFSWEYFTNKLVSLLITYLYSDNVLSLPFYNGFNNIVEDNLIECLYTGSTGLKDITVDGDYVYIKASVILKNTYLVKGNRVKTKDVKYNIDIKRNITRPVNLHFSMRAFNCKNCGSSFDTTKTNVCPHCSSRFYFADEDWLITSVDKY